MRVLFFFTLFFFSALSLASGLEDGPISQDYFPGERDTASEDYFYQDNAKGQAEQQKKTYERQKVETTKPDVMDINPGWQRGDSARY